MVVVSSDEEQDPNTTVIPTIKVIQNIIFSYDPPLSIEKGRIIPTIYVPGMVLTNTEITPYSHYRKQRRSVQFSQGLYSC